MCLFNHLNNIYDIMKIGGMPLINGANPVLYTTKNLMAPILTSSKIL